jgi:hypothetical protein
MRGRRQCPGSRDELRSVDAVLLETWETDGHVHPAEWIGRKLPSHRLERARSVERAQCLAERDRVDRPPGSSKPSR